MSTHHHASGGGPSRGQDETLVQDYLEGEATKVAADVTSLVDGAMVTGRAHRRRRRIVTAVGAAAAVALVAGGVGWGLQPGGLLSGSVQPADSGTVRDLVPSTPRGLAAAVMTHGTDADLITVGGKSAEKGALAAVVGYKIGGRTAELEVVASPNVQEWDQMAPCAHKIPES
ncbi:MAG: hypothetical protein ACRDQA_20760, partial [Nocardioidaceae bacterium]